MRFRHRLGWYSVGFFLGLFFVSMVFLGKDTRCNYFPNARVLNDFRSKSFKYSPEAREDMRQLGMGENDIIAILHNGDVDFSRSNVPYEGGKKYIVEGETLKELQVELTVVNYTDKAVLKNIGKAE
jgi:hypothetical protein